MAFLAIPAGCQMLRTERWFWHPAGVRPLTVPEPGGIAPLDPRLPSGIPPGCPSPTSPPHLCSTENSKEPIVSSQSDTNKELPPQNGATAPSAPTSAPEWRIFENI